MIYLKQQRGFSGMSVLLAVMLAMIVISYVLQQENMRKIRKFQDEQFESLAHIIAGQMDKINKGAINWFQTQGESLLYPGCASYQNCMVGVKRNILPQNALAVRSTGAFAPGFARLPADPNNDWFYSPLGGHYRMFVIKVEDPENPGNYIYRFAIAHLPRIN